MVRMRGKDDSFIAVRLNGGIEADQIKGVWVSLCLVFLDKVGGLDHYASCIEETWGLSRIRETEQKMRSYSCWKALTDDGDRTHNLCLSYTYIRP